jgi:hypothetical protein
MSKDFVLSYLYVFFDEEPRQATTAPTNADISLIASDLLQVFRWYSNAYEQLLVKQGKPVWEKIEEANLYNDAEEMGE